MRKKFYVVPAIKEKHKVKIKFLDMSCITEIPLSWTDGVFGAMPVFTNKRKAEKYAGKRKNEIIVFESIRRE